MRTLILFVAIVFLNNACSNSSAETPKSEVKDQYLSLYGNWVGQFIAVPVKPSDSLGTWQAPTNRINLIIKKIDPDLRVTAESIVAGNKRKLVGQMEVSEGAYIFSLREPGNDKHDGVFEFTIAEEDGKANLKGTWTAFDSSLPVVKREYSLARQAFRYDKNLMLSEEYELFYDFYDSKAVTVTDTVSTSDTTDTYSIDDTSTFEVRTYQRDLYAFAGESIFTINASKRKLKAEELKNLKKLELEIIRNTIFARHGYTFKKRKMRQFFDFVDWYVPVSTNITKELTTIEKENIELLLRFENYATNYYDSFGR